MRKARGVREQVAQSDQSDCGPQLLIHQRPDATGEVQALTKPSLSDLPGKVIGKPEEWVLLAVINTADAGMPGEIYEQMAKGAEEDLPAFGAVYTTLGRMARKGLLKESSKTDASGRTRRAFTITGAGRVALKQSIDRIHAMGGFGLAGAAYG